MVSDEQPDQAGATGTPALPVALGREDTPDEPPAGEPLATRNAGRAVAGALTGGPGGGGRSPVDFLAANRRLLLPPAMATATATAGTVANRTRPPHRRGTG